MNPAQWYARPIPALTFLALFFLAYVAMTRVGIPEEFKGIAAVPCLVAAAMVSVWLREKNDGESA